VIPVNAVSTGFTKTVEQGAAEAVRVALLGRGAPTGRFTHATMGVLPWWSPTVH
jgi:hypothetical protein